ncbi:Uncharacterized protein MSYG_0292 [Malassezia sympodialis ATCC 42132]|uniref:Uncharacterized protein n=1 Tax=Malassezia sympodialis (strain ATCC 42132) TaxID=1230383 RepID=A0A1M8A0I4_MALS4|nr:Uncharacterized protein MSYG_0292 [Malassezia sympodialis ATCC 42132]
MRSPHPWSIMYPLRPKGSRKFLAVRSIKREVSELADNTLQESSKEIIVNSTPWNASLSNLDSDSRVEMYALVNDRYPGAPGTALAKAEEAGIRSMQAKKREQSRRNAKNAELEHIGIKNLPRRRHSTSPFATSSNASTATNSDSEDRSSGPIRAPSRHRRVLSRASSPLPLSSNESDTNPRWLPHLPHLVTNAPVNPSPLATHAIGAADMR